MTVRGVLFDLDGVLVDSAALHIRAYERVFAEAQLSFPTLAKSAVLEGKPRSFVIDVALPSAPLELKQKLANAKPKALRAILESAGDCSMPGATETVLGLAEEGVPMAVVTNSRAPQMWLRKLRISNLIRAVVTRDDVASPKPSPEGYLLGASRLNIKPERCLAVEDSREGWLAAMNAGMQVVVVADRRPAWLDANAELIRSLDATDILQRLARA